MFTQDQSQWQQVVNPSTGRPFSDYGEYQTWAGGMEKQGAAASSGFNTAGDSASMGEGAGNQFAKYDWGNTGGYKDDWGSSIMPSGTDASGKFQFQSRTPAGGGMYNYSGGYIDPKTGKITFTIHDTKGGGGSGASSPVTGEPITDYLLGGGSSGSKAGGSVGGARVQGSANYDAYQDYGLGTGLEGIIPIAHDSNGTPIKFYAPTQSGGGQVFDSIDQAQSAVEGYRQWHNDAMAKNRSANGTPVAGGGSTFTPTGTSGNGALTTPGQGEEFFDLTKKDYLAGPQRGDRAFGDRPTQPTESEQYWNQWEGQFQNPDSLKGVYDRAEKQAQSTLDRKASSSGWADSSAAAKATANIGQNFNDAYVRAAQDWAKTGGQLAGAADTSKNAQTNAWLNEVNAAQGLDQTNLSYLTGGQAAATGAQTLKENRLTGGFDRSLAVANNMSAIAAYGLDKKNQQDIAYKMADLQQQIRMGTMDYNQAVSQLDEYMATLRVAPSAATSIKGSLKAWNDTSTGTKGTV